MAKGAESKDKIVQKLMSTFEGAFIASDGKTVRIPMSEMGEPVEIKVTLTAAKDLEGGGAIKTSAFPEVEFTGEEPIKPTEQEMADVAAMMDMLGL